MQLFIVTLMLAAATAAAVGSERSQESRERARGLRGARGARGLRGVSEARGARGVSGARGERIVRDDFDTPTAEGDYKWAIQTEGGIYHEQRGSKSAAGAEGAAGAVGAAGAAGAVVQGQYQYTAPDGQVFNVVYIADSLGFRATAPHLPTPPPPPPAIARALAYTARLREQGKINL